MRTRFEFANPDELTATVTMTATVKEWRELMRQLPRDWPSWDLANQIAEVVAAAQTKFHAGSPNA